VRRVSVSVRRWAPAAHARGRVKALRGLIDDLPADFDGRRASAQAGGVEQRRRVVADPGAVDPQPPVAGIGARVFESDLALRAVVDARARERSAEDDRGAGLDEAAAVEVVAPAGRARHARVNEEAGPVVAVEIRKDMPSRLERL